MCRGQWMGVRSRHCPRRHRLLAKNETAWVQVVDVFRDSQSVQEATFHVASVANADVVINKLQVPRDGAFWSVNTAFELTASSEAVNKFTVHDVVSFDRCALEEFCAAAHGVQVVVGARVCQGFFGAEDNFGVCRCLQDEV